MGSLIIAIIGLVLSMAGYAVDQSLQAHANQSRDRLTKIANQIYTKINKNTALLDKLQDAYNRRDSDLGNALLSSAGFGPAVVALRKEQERSKDDFAKKKENLVKENVDLTNKYNQANNALVQAGGSFAQNKYADDTADQLEQSLQGGINNA